MIVAETRTLVGWRHRVLPEDFLLRLNLPVQGIGADGLKAALGLLWERRAAVPSAFPNTASAIAARFSKVPACGSR